MSRAATRRKLPDADTLTTWGMHGMWDGYDRLSHLHGRMRAGEDVGPLNEAQGEAIADLAVGLHAVARDLYPQQVARVERDGPHVVAPFPTDRAPGVGV